MFGRRKILSTNSYTYEWTSIFVFQMRNTTTKLALILFRNDVSGESILRCFLEQTDRIRTTKNYLPESSS